MYNDQSRSVGHSYLTTAWHGPGTLGGFMG